jgi:hypothetical protein
MSELMVVGFKQDKYRASVVLTSFGTSMSIGTLCR